MDTVNEAVPALRIQGSIPLPSVHSYVSTYFEHHTQNYRHNPYCAMLPVEFELDSPMWLATPSGSEQHSRHFRLCSSCTIWAFSSIGAMQVLVDHTKGTRMGHS